MTHDASDNDLQAAADELLADDVAAAENVTPGLGEQVVLRTGSSSTRPARAEVESGPRPGRLRVARPRDPLELRAQAEEAEVLAAEREMAEARRRVADAEERAEAARLAAAESRAEAQRLRAAEAERVAEESLAAEAELADPVVTEEPVAEEISDDQLARDRALGRVTVVDEEPAAVVPVTDKRTTDKFWASLGLFLVRLVLSVLVGLWGYQCLIYREQVENALAKIGLQVGTSNALAVSLGVVLMLMAVLLLIGFGTRVVAAILVLLLGVFLAFFRFGPFNPVLEGQWGFYGDYELLLAVVAFLFVCTGGGGWSVDHGVRAGRQRRRETV